MIYKDHKQYRLPGYDYSQEGFFFITICIKNRIEYFGEIINGKMIFSEYGKIANDFWKQLPEKYPNLVLDEFQIMPEHMHGILHLKNINDACRNTPRRVPTGHVPTGNDQTGRVPTGNLHPLVKNSVSSIINHFKGDVKKWCIRNGVPDFNWQPRFRDRIIRNDIELYFTREYIISNPVNWGKDDNDEDDYLDNYLDNYFEK